MLSLKCKNSSAKKTADSDSLHFLTGYHNDFLNANFQKRQLYLKKY